MTKEMQKKIAAQCLEKLGIYKPYIRKFKSEESMPCFFENFGGFYVDQEPEVYEKVKEVEKNFGCLVYAITHEFYEFGECWSMLCVSDESEGIEDCLDDCGGNTFYTFSYVWNQTNEQCSEFGDVVVKSFGGGIRRIG